ncbi:MAG TPA: DUF6599 family protein [Terriglobia bacterium]|nr:DUF6599 family protein [Terriglobia bacterium]
MLATLAFFAACAPKSPSAPTAYLPETGDVEGWTKADATRTFPADRLYEYIDGDADRFVKAGAGQALTSDYRYRGKTDAVVDVFVMKDAAGSATVFESYSSGGSQSPQLGDAARLYPGTLLFRRGRFFVRVVVYDEGPDAAGTLLSLGRAIDVRIR